MGVGKGLREQVEQPRCISDRPRGVRALAVVHCGKAVRCAVGHDPYGGRSRGRRLRQGAGAAVRGALPAEHRRDLLHVPAPRLGAWRLLCAGLRCRGSTGCLRHRVHDALDSSRHRTCEPDAGNAFRQVTHAAACLPAGDAQDQRRLACCAAAAPCAASAKDVWSESTAEASVSANNEACPQGTQPQCTGGGSHTCVCGWRARRTQKPSFAPQGRSTSGSSSASAPARKARRAAADRASAVETPEMHSWYTASVATMA